MTSCSNCSWRCRTGSTTFATGISTPGGIPWFSTGTASNGWLCRTCCRSPSLTEDAKGDHSFNANWADGDYRLVPYNSSPAKPWGTPYNAIEAGGRRTVFKEGEGNLRVEGVWGYRALLRR